MASTIRDVLEELVDAGYTPENDSSGRYEYLMDEARDALNAKAPGRQEMIDSIAKGMWLRGMGTKAGGPLFAADLIDEMTRKGYLSTIPVEPPLVLIHVDGGIAEEWYVVPGTGKPVVSILDFDFDDPSDEDLTDFVETARETLATFKARGIDTTDLDHDVDRLMERIGSDEDES